MKLNYKISGSGQPLLILHGLFGSSDNWRGIAKRLSHVAQVISVDLRNHGCSPHSQQISYQLMAEDLLELVDDLGLDKIDLMGHSIGGKVAMAFSQYYSERLAKLMIIDIAPKRYQDQHRTIFEALLTLDLTTCLSRKQADEALAISLPDQAVRRFLLMNLVIDSSRIRWQINLQSLYDNYSELLQAVCQQTIIANETCFMRGSRSDYIEDQDIAIIETTFIDSHIYTIEGAGHWMHIDAPEAFISKVMAFFNYD